MALKYLRIIALLILLATGGTVAITAGDSENAPPAAPKTAHPDPYKKGRTAFRPNPGSDLASNLRAETGISRENQFQNAELSQTLRHTRGARIGPACRNDFSGHVYSDRAPGVKPTEFVLHYTVSHNTPGWGDILAVQNYFKNTRVGSAHFIVDFEGHCLKMVPLAKKAWTQGNANSYATSVEVIAYGDEPASAWKNAPLFKDQILAGLVRRVMDYQGIPLTRVDPAGCVFPPGWTDHNHLECGNDHHDVSPHFPFRVFRRQLLTVR